MCRAFLLSSLSLSLSLSLSQAFLTTICSCFHLLDYHLYRKSKLSNNRCYKSTSAFQKSSSKRRWGRRRSEIETARMVLGSVSKLDVLWWFQLEEEVNGWRCVQDFGFAQGKQLWLRERMWWVDGGAAVDLADEVCKGEVVVEGQEVWVLSWFVGLGWFGGFGCEGFFLVSFFSAIVCGCCGFGWWLVATMVGGCGVFFFLFSVVVCGCGGSGWWWRWWVDVVVVVWVVECGGCGMCWSRRTGLRKRDTKEREIERERIKN